MIGPVKIARRTKSSCAWHEGFLALLPAIRRYSRMAFRQLREEAQEEAVAETIANALVAYVRLCERGKAALAYPTVLARFAIKQIISGRRVGTRQNVKDVFSANAGKRGGFSIERLSHYIDIDDDGEWIEATIEDPQTPVPDQAAFRCDFPAWLATHRIRQRRIAESLALGHSTGDVARRFRITSARVSQLRSDFRRSWNAFHDEVGHPAAALPRKTVVSAA